MKYIEECCEDVLNDLRSNSMVYKNSRYFNYMHFYTEQFGEKNKIFCFTNTKEIIFFKANEDTLVNESAKFQEIGKNDFQKVYQEYLDCLSISKQFWENELVKYKNDFSNQKGIKAKKDVQNSQKNLGCGIAVTIPFVVAELAVLSAYSSIDGNEVTKVFSSMGIFLGSYSLVAICEAIIYWRSINVDKNKKDNDFSCEDIARTKKKLIYALYKNLLLESVSNEKRTINESRLNRNLERLEKDNNGLCSLIRQKERI